MPVPHPVDRELDDFLLGKLEGPDHARLEGHLSECSECLAAASAKANADTFVELLVAADTRLTLERSVASTPVPNATPSAFSPTVDLLSPASRAYDPLLPPPELANHPRYRLIRLIGAGGMGTVWLAEHLVLGREVAVKVIRPEFLTKPGASERFRREARSVAHLAHPNIVAAYDAEEANGIHFLAMEYVPGENLGARLRSSGPLPVAEACRAARDVARALAAAHSAGMIHRDVKPQNLIRMPDGVTKVLDFGLVATAVGDLHLKTLDFGLVHANASQPDLTGGDVLVGTPDYIAPEQAEDARAADARSDIYSLGCTLYHLLAGRVPFPEGNMLQKLDSHRGCEPTPIPGLPDGLTAVLAKMTAKRPAVRYDGRRSRCRAESILFHSASPKYKQAE
jgi:serine/threonine protein kinase